MGKNRILYGLGNLQAEVMEIVWELGEATVTQVHERITKRRQITYTTALVAMQKLDKKGWLTHRREGRANVYWPKRSREATHTGLLRDIMKQAFCGEPHLLMSHLVQQHPMTEEQLASLRKLIDDLQNEKRDE